MRDGKLDDDGGGNEDGVVDDVASADGVDVADGNGE